MKPKTILLNRPILFATVVFLSFALYGCSPSLVGENTAAYSMGYLHARLDSDMNSVYNASVTGLEKLEIKVTDKQKDVFGAKVIGKTSDEQTIKIVIKPISDTSTKVIGETSDDQSIKIKIEPMNDTSSTLSIHVGMIGNEERSRAIYDQIRKELGTMARG